MLSPREAFQIGFLARCAELGLTAAETEKVASAAQDLLVKQGLSLESLWNPAKSLVGSGLQAGVLGAALAPPALGAAAGYGLGRLTDVDDEDVDSVKQQELIDEYMRQAERLRHRDRRYRSLRAA